MVLCECACANVISKANFNLINETDLFICLHVMFQISFQNSKEQKSYRKFLDVRSELLLSIYVDLYLTPRLSMCRPADLALIMNIQTWLIIYYIYEYMQIYI